MAVCEKTWARVVGKDCSVKPKTSQVNWKFL